MSDTQWHLSRSVPITFLLAIALQTVALIWFVATLRNDIDTNQTAITRVEARTDSLEKVVQSQAITMARMDENLKAMNGNIEAIRTAVEKLADVPR